MKIGRLSLQIRGINYQSSRTNYFCICKKSNLWVSAIVQGCLPCTWKTQIQSLTPHMVFQILSGVILEHRAKSKPVHCVVTQIQEERIGEREGEKMEIMVCYNMDETWEYHVKWNKGEESILDDVSYLWNIDKPFALGYKTDPMISGWRMVWGKRTRGDIRTEVEGINTVNINTSNYGA